MAPLPKPQTVTSSPPKTPLTEREEEQEEKPVYVYSGDRFKDPFLKVGQSAVYQPDAIFQPERAKVKAIIYSRRMQSALIQIAGGGSYFVKGGRIFDVMGKTMTGYKAKVFQQKVVITGEADEIYELKIRELEGEEDQT